MKSLTYETSDLKKLVDEMCSLFTDKDGKKIKKDIIKQANKFTKKNLDLIDWGSLIRFVKNVFHIIEKDNDLTLFY